jgi:Leucine-rich repeat (LRR) protein
MKKLLLILLCLPMIGFGQTLIPDANFEQALINLGYDTGTPNGSVPTANIDTVTSLDVWNDSIADLTGIEDFTALTSLSCYGNQLTSLDVSQNTALADLYCHSNQLTSLDVSNNLALNRLYCYSNQLTSLDVSNNLALTAFTCYDNQLTSLDVSQNTALADLYCHSNQLTSLDVSNNLALNRLYCSSNQLTSLSVSNNTTLTTLDCANNQIQSLDVNFNTALNRLFCYLNQLTSLDVSANTALADLYCYSNQLTSLDVSQNTALTILRCYHNQLTSLDVSNNTTLTGLYCNYNQLISLDVSGNLALNRLYCYSNQLTNLDVSNNDSLVILDCGNNQLTNLDVSNNTFLYQLHCQNQQLTSLDVRNGNNTNFTDFFSTNNPNLYCIDVDDAVWSNANWLNIDAWSSFSINCPPIIYGCTDSLACNYNPLATIDDSSCVYNYISQLPFSIISCDGWLGPDGNYYTNSGIFSIVIGTTSAGCDSILNFNLNIAPAKGDTLIVNSCDSLVWNGVIYYSSDTSSIVNYVVHTFSNGDSIICDSISYLFLTINHNLSSYDTLSASSSIVWNNLLVTTTGIYSTTLINSIGCDSIAYLNFTITIPSGILDITNNERTLVKITDMLGQETPYRRNTPLFYIYDDGTVEKRIVIE